MYIYIFHYVYIYSIMFPHRGWWLQAVPIRHVQSLRSHKQIYQQNMVRFQPTRNGGVFISQYFIPQKKVETCGDLK
jgi:hypothetical protein